MSGHERAARPRLAVIGAGVMGSYHARVIAQSDRAELTHVFEPNAELGEQLAGRFGARWAPNIDGFAGLDAVVVAASTEAHADLATRALENGTPVLVEKPVTADLAQTERLVELSRRVQTPLMCGFVERFNPALQTVLPMVTEPVHLAAIRHSPFAPRIRTGVAWDLLIHDVDACLRLVNDEPAAVRAALGSFHPNSPTHSEDVAEAVMTFAGGAVASVSASRIGQRKTRSIRITELARTIEIDLLSRAVTIYRHVSADFRSQEGLGYRQQTVIEIIEVASTREPLAAQFDRFLDVIDGTVDMKEELESILPAHRVVDQIMTAA